MQKKSVIQQLSTPVTFLILYTPFIPFFCDEGAVAFFARPGPVFWILLFGVFVFRHFHGSPLINFKEPFFQLLLFCSVLNVFLIAIHFGMDSKPNYNILALYLSFILYVLLFYTIFFDRIEALSKMIIFLVYIMIVIHTIISVLELHLIENGIISYKSLWNKANLHYLATSRRKYLLFTYRPLGLFGQFTINGVVPIIAFLSLVYLERMRKGLSITMIYRRHAILAVIVVVNVLYSGSITAVFTAFFVIGSLIFVYNGGFLKISGFILVTLCMGLAVVSGELTKFEDTYYRIVSNIGNAIRNVSFVSGREVFEFFIGVDHGFSRASPDTSLLYIFSMLGMAGLILHLLLYFGLIHLVANRELKLVIVSIFFGSMHYPMMGPQCVHVLFSLLLTHYLLTRASRNHRGLKS